MDITCNFAVHHGPVKGHTRVRIVRDDVIKGERLTTFDIEPDGSRFCVNVADVSGSPRGLSLPAECMTQLIMTLPKMAARLLSLQYRDESMRIVYPLDELHIEGTHTEKVSILTLATADGFSVSFGLSEDDLKELETTARKARNSLKSTVVKN